MVPDVRDWPDDSTGLIQRRVACDLDPLEVLARLGGQPGLTGLIGSWAGGGALITFDPVTPVGSIGDIDWHSATAAGDEVAALPDPAGFVGGGWFGVLGYQLGHRFERLPAPPPRPTPVSALRMSYFDHVLRYDAGAGTWWFESVASQERAERHYRQITAQLRGRAPAPSGYRFGPFRVTPGPAAHQDAVARCLEHIAAGDIFQANICLRAEAAFQGDPLAAFIRGARALRPAYAAYVDTTHGAVASFSPELFLERRGRAVLTSPIKGTAPLSADPRNLVSSGKDQAENTMIVDLMRNDLSRICLAGSVHVPSGTRAEAHTGVWHLVRDVSGTLRAGVADSDLVRATFPPGSVTGAPKVRAMELISQLETTGREAYTGAIGYACARRLELNVAIRTVEFLGGTAWIGVGGGIVLDSDPAREMQECLDKLQPLLTAVGAALDEPALDAPARPPSPWQHGPLTAWPQARFRDTPQAPPRPPRRRPVPRRRVLLVDNYDSFVHNLARYCQELGARTAVLRNDEPELDPGSIADRYDHVIISPGPGDPASAGRSVEIIRRLAGVLPILGVCLGHQCIGEAFGGRTVRAPCPVHGRQSLIRHDQQGIFAGLPPLLAAGRYHSLVTDESTLPASLIPTARTPAGLLMGVRHRHYPVHGIQVHPESILTPRGHDMLANFLTIPELPSNGGPPAAGKNVGGPVEA